jgi:hypothetical protein
MSKLKEISEDKKRMIRVLQTPDGTFILGVLCGGIGMYEVLVVLTKEEKEGFLLRGMDELVPLARKISYLPEDYRDRWFFEGDE